MALSTNDPVRRLNKITNTSLSIRPIALVEIFCPIETVSRANSFNG